MAKKVRQKEEDEEIEEQGEDDTPTASQIAERIQPKPDPKLKVSTGPVTKRRIWMHG